MHELCKCRKSYFKLERKSCMKKEYQQRSRSWYATNLKTDPSIATLHTLLWIIGNYMKNEADAIISPTVSVSWVDFRNCWSPSNLSFKSKLSHLIFKYDFLGENFRVKCKYVYNRFSWLNRSSISCSRSYVVPNIISVL